MTMIVMSGTRQRKTRRQATTAAMPLLGITIMVAATCGAILHDDAVQYARAQEIENDQIYVGDDGSIHVVGEIANTLDVPLSGAVVHVTIHDADGSIILAEDTTSLVNTIMPGMSGPFDLVVAGSDMPPRLADGHDDVTYALDLEYDFADPKMQVIDIARSELARDRHGNMIITGTVANRGEITANMISVVATIYDDAGNVAAVTRVHTEPDYLRAGEGAFFIVAIPDKEHAADAIRYDLVAESEEYAAVPEFPMGMTILLIGTFAAYVAATRLVKIPMTSLISAADPR